MSQQPSLFDSPDVPIAGHTATARAASLSGARKVARTWTARQAALLGLLDQPRTRVEMAGLLGWPISSVCSILASVRGEVQSAGLARVAWDDGSVTQRERFEMRKP